MPVDLNAALQTVLGDDQGCIMGAFASMELAEDEIERSGLPIAQRCFRACMPSDVLTGAAEPLYRSHVRELIQRAEAGGDMTLPTAAEFCALLAATSLNAPLKPAWSCLYGRKFALCFPDGSGGVQTSFFADEHEIAEAEFECSRKLRQSWRKVTNGSD